LTFPQEIPLRFDDRLKAHAALEAKRFEAERLSKAYAWKCGLGDGFPLIVCLVGGTGTGKSTLFNSLAGRKISEVGTRRPHTLRAVVLAHQDVLERLADCPFLDSANGKEAVIVPHGNPETAGPILVDTPDFDSVELANRRIADDFFIVSDVMTLVTSQEKYGDLAGHQMSLRAKSWNKSILFVMNKVASDTAFQDFRNTLQAQGFQSEPIRVERIQPPPDLIPDFRERPEFAELLWSQRSEEIRRAELQNLRRQTLAGLQDLRATATEQFQRIEAINEKIQALLGPITREMDAQLHAIVTEDMEAQIRERLQKLLRKYDILFVPRMMVRNAVKKVFFAIFGTLGSQPQEAVEEKDFREEDFKATRATVRLNPLESAVTQFNLKLAELLSSDPGWEDLRMVARDDVPRWDSQEIQRRYDEAFPGIEHLLEMEFEKIRQGLSFADEVKLYGSYTLWALLLITAEIAVGGGISFIDVFLNTVIVPFIPKWLLNLKVLEILREVGERVDQQHQNTLHAILARQAELYTDRFNGMLPEPEAINTIQSLIKQLQEAHPNHPTC
jgi:energy-coupling factor transporter ATP-binding protein EcfA2